MEGNADFKHHLINWDNVSKPKKEGGLGIGGIPKRNAALLGKWLWRFPNNSSFGPPSFEVNSGLALKDGTPRTYFIPPIVVLGKVSSNLSAFLFPH